MRPVDAAIAYAARGWAVFPVHGILEHSCTCRRGCADPGKHPMVARGFHAASRDPQRILRWWDRWPSANIGVATGAASGIVVLDVDPRSGGECSLEALTARRGPIPETLSARTGGGGWHLFFAHPGGQIPNTAGRLPGHTASAPGLDVRGDGGYIIVPPSVHASGTPYRWVDADQSPAPAPPWLQPPPPDPERVAPAVPAGRPAGYGAAALAGEMTRVAAAQPGTRNQTLNQAAFALGTLVASNMLSDVAVVDGLLSAAVAAGLSPREARATIRSGLRAGARHPRRSTPTRTIPSPRRSSSNGHDQPTLEING